jgi:DNA-binding MarR family transcriptional regulator
VDRQRATRADRRRVQLTDHQLHAWRSFFHMQQVLRGRLEQSLQATSGLSNADYSVLAALAEVPNRRIRAFQLGTLLGWEKSRLHHQLTRMCTRGLIERELGESRAIYVVLTRAGLRALAAAAPTHLAQVRELVIDRLTPDQLDQLAHLSNTILEGLVAGDDVPSGTSA